MIYSSQSIHPKPEEAVMEEFKKQLAELTPHSPLGWDSDSLADAVCHAVRLSYRVIRGRDGIRPHTFPGRNTRWYIAYYSPYIIDAIVLTLLRFVDDQGANNPSAIDVEVSCIPNSDSLAQESYIVIHTPKA